MSGFVSIKNQLQNLIDQANAKTGLNDTDVTTAMNTLCEGYGDALLQEKTVTENGVIVVPDEGYDGLSKVVVNVTGGSLTQKFINDNVESVSDIDINVSVEVQL